MDASTFSARLPNNFEISNGIEQSAVSTPKTYASFGRRLLARLLDLLILYVFSMILFFIFNYIRVFLQINEGSPAFVFSMITLFIGLGIDILYYVYLIGSRGQTLGKKILGVKVVRESNQMPPPYLTAFLREFLATFVSPWLLGLGYLWMVWDSKKQTWHDKVAGTIVLKI